MAGFELFLFPNFLVPDYFWSQLFFAWSYFWPRAAFSIHQNLLLKTRIYSWRQSHQITYQENQSCAGASCCLHPTFRSKISYFIIFPAIDFEFSVDLLDFYAGSKSNYMVYLETKNDIIQFSPNAMMSLNYLNLFQKRYQEKYWFSKKYCGMYAYYRYFVIFQNLKLLEYP